MSRTKKKRVPPPKRIRHKAPKVYTLGPALIKLLEAEGFVVGTPEEDATSVPSGEGDQK